MSSAEERQQPITDWNSIINKDVKTADYQNAGKVFSVPENEDVVILSYEGSSADYHYKIPRSYVQGFDGPFLLLSITRTEMANYEIRDIETYAAQLRSIKKEEEGKKMVFPVVEEKLNISKKVLTDEVIITKEPITETKTVDVSVMSEVLVIEKRPPTDEVDSSSNITTATKTLPEKTKQSSSTTNTEIRIPLTVEQAEIKKEPYVIEEILIRKEPITETKTIRSTLTTESLHVVDNTKS
jgi:stress response protein YsnF